MKKVVHLSKFYKPYKGGLEAVVSDICEGVQYPAVVLAADKDCSEHKQIINNVVVFRSKEWVNVASTSLAPSYILDAIKNVSGSIVHLHYPNPLANFAFFVSSFFLGDKCETVVHWHSDIVKQKYLLYLYMPLMKWSLRKAKVIIVTSEQYLEGSPLLRDYKCKCRVVPIGIDGLASRVECRKVKSIREKYNGKHIIFSLGRHIYYKGFEYLIKSALYVDDAVFLIGGSGPDSSMYQNLIERYSLSDKVFLIGRVEDEDLASYYSAADVFCLSSIEKSEAFGVVQLEAMSVGTPVVSTDIPYSGVPWVNEDGVSGLICNPRDEVDLAEKINTIIKDESLKKSLSQGALNRFKENFTKEKMVESIENIYSDL